MKFYSPSTRGFYSEDVHGARRVQVMQGEDEDRRLVEVDNPTSKIPADAVEITDEEWAALLEGQATGKVIQPGANGHPVLATPPGPALADYLPQRRWQAEIEGTTWNGWFLPTDDRSQAKYLAELAAVNEGVRQDGQVWKFAHGFEALTNQQVRDMAVAARAHVLACFAKEAEVAMAISKGTITTTAEIDAAFKAMGQ